VCFRDVPDNRQEVVRILARKRLLPQCDHALHQSLIGPLDLGTGGAADVRDFHIFQRRDANTPLAERGAWLVQIPAPGPPSPPSAQDRRGRAERLLGCAPDVAAARHLSDLGETTRQETPPRSGVKKTIAPVITPLAHSAIHRRRHRRIVLRSAQRLGRQRADDSPETGPRRRRTSAWWRADCSSIILAHEEAAYFKKFGINSTVSKGASWAAIRGDSLTNGDIQATHMLLGMPMSNT